MTNLLNFIGGVFIAIGSFFAPHALAPSQNLGTASFSPVQTPPFFLSGSGLTSNATTVVLTSMAYANGGLVTMADLGSIGYATIEPGTTREEQVSFTNIVQNNNGTAILTGVTRGLAFNPGTQGCNGSSSLQIAHAGGSQFVLSNTACFYTQYAAVANTSTITGNWAFSSTVPTSNLSNSSIGASNSNLATVGYVASTSFAGAPNGSLTQKGLFQEATQGQMAIGSSTGSSGADLVVSNRYSSLTASTSPVNVVASGTLDPSYLLNGNYNLGSTTAQSLASASTTFTNVTSSLLQTGATGVVSGLSAGTTVGALNAYSGAFQVGFPKVYVNLATTSIKNSYASLGTTTIPSASTGSIYQFWFQLGNGGQAFSSTVSVNGVNLIQTTGGNICQVNGSGNTQLIGQLIMLNSTSVAYENISMYDDAINQITPICTDQTIVPGLNMGTNPQFNISMRSTATSTMSESGTIMMFQ